MTNYVIGVDLSEGRDKTAVCLCEERHGAMYIVGSGVHDDSFEAFLLAMQEAMRSYPWWKRLWKKLMWRRAKVYS